jgi:hypothetical protein
MDSPTFFKSHFWDMLSEKEKSEFVDTFNFIQNVAKDIRYLNLKIEFTQVAFYESHFWHGLTVDGKTRFMACL